MAWASTRMRGRGPTTATVGVRARQGMERGGRIMVLVSNWSRCTRQGGQVYTTAGVLNPAARCVNTDRRVSRAKEPVMSAAIMLRSSAAMLSTDLSTAADIVDTPGTLTPNLSALTATTPATLHP